MALHRNGELEQQNFRGMLVDIALGMSDGELETLKFYCADFIPTARREDIKMTVHLWEAIIEKGRISPTDTTFLEELMDKAIGRHDLLDKVKQYAHCVHLPQHEVLIREFEYIAENVNARKWRHLVRTLGVADAAIDRLEEQYNRNIREQVLQALLLWAHRAGARATRTVLIDALTKSQLRLLADRLEDLGPLQ